MAKIDRSTVPLHFMRPNNSACKLMAPAAMKIATEVREAGRNPDDLILLCQELGNGELAVGVFEKGKTNADQLLDGLGFVIPWGFWYTSDGRVPLCFNALNGPLPDYCVPNNQPNIALVPRP